MRRQTLAGWIFAGSVAAACAVVIMIWPTVEPAIGYWLLAGCAFLALIAVALLFWPQPPKGAPMSDDKKHGPVGIHIEGSSNVHIANNRGSGLSSFIRAVNSEGLNVHGNESNGTHTFMDLEGVKDLNASGNVHNRKAQDEGSPLPTSTGPKPKREKPRGYFSGWRPPKDDE